MKRIAAVLALIAAVGVATAQPAEAGIAADSVEINYVFFGGSNAESAAAAEAASGQLFDESGTDVSAQCSDGPVSSGMGSNFTTTCTNLTPQIYTLGIVGVDDYYVDSVTCGLLQPNEAIDDPNASFTHTAGGDTSCIAFFSRKPSLYIDKLATGGPLGASDFPIEIYDDTGTLVPVTSATVDPDDAQCSFEFGGEALTDAADSIIDTSICAEVLLEPGDYTMGEVLPDYGYVESSLVCESELILLEMLPSPAFDFSHGAFGSDTLCTLTNDYVTQTVSADIEVTNDDGGTATGADFTIEVFDNTGTLVDSGVDPEPGTGNASAEFLLPIGEYTFGVEGPDGYDASAAVTVVVTGATENLGAAAAFTLTPDQTASAVIGVDDQTVATTTTSTTTTTTSTTTTSTTTTPTTVAATTTLATTTTMTALLPETGASTDQTLPLVLMAIGFLVLGAGAVIATRRP